MDNKLKNIYKESDGVYRIEISNGFRDDGTRDRIVERVYGREDEAIRRRDEIKTLQQKKKEEGLKDQNGGYTLIEVSKLYLADTNYKKRSLSTERGYKQLLNNWILPNLGNIKIRNISEVDLEKLYTKMRSYKNERTGEPLSETYISHCHKLIKAIYNYAKKKKWVLSNPADYVLNPPKIKSVERDYYSYDEMLEVYDLLENYDIRFKTAITLLFNTGLRRGELFGLKWKDVVYKKIPIIENGVRTFQYTTILKINKEVITVSKKVMQEKDFSFKYNIIEIITDTLVAIKPKTEKSIRNIVVVDRCYDLLEEYKQFQIDNGFTPSDEDYIFRTLDNVSIWNPGYLTREWEKFLKENVLKKITIHDIRHSHATYLLSLGVPPQDVARRLGHSEPTTTLKIYTHSNLLQDQKIANMIAQNVYYGYESVKEETISPEIVLKLFLTDNISSSDKSLYSSIEWICNNKNINVDEIDDYLEISKKHIIENNNSLKSFVGVINHLSSEERKILLDGINDIFNLDKPLKLDKINDIIKYENYRIKI